MNKLLDMKRLLFILVFAATFVACERHSEHWDTLTEVESYIEEHPDSALVVLEKIDVSELSGKEERAKHALLLSMAMDKNYIDRTDFEVLQPAIDYYEDNGTATYKLRTYYYQGRIYQNAGNDALAMECFVNAISNGGKSEDIQTIAKVYYNQSKIYSSLYDWDNCIENLQKASNLYYKSGLNDYYIDCLSLIINCYTLKKDYTAALPYIDECKQLIETMSTPTLCTFYTSYITHIVKSGTNAEIKNVIEECLNTIPSESVDWLPLTNAYIELGQYEDALQTIEQCMINSYAIDELKYKALISIIYEKLGRYEESLRAYKEYMVVSDSTTWAIMQQDTKFVEERHNLEMAKAKETEAKNRLTIIVLSCIVALLISLYILNLIRKQLKRSRVENAQLLSEKALYEQMYNEVVAERDAFNEMIANNAIKEEAMEIIKKRLGVLNTIIVSHLSAKDTDIKRANEELERLIANRNDFIKSTRLTLEENYPHFFAYLHDKGLEEFEIDFCCLYAIGLKGKEIKAYTNLTRHYKDSSEVRQKLGLSESDTNLSNFLQKLLKMDGE